MRSSSGDTTTRYVFSRLPSPPSSVCLFLLLTTLLFSSLFNLLQYNAWIDREVLLKLGFGKIVGQFDDIESSREGAGSRDNSAAKIREHLEALGMDGDIAQYNEIRGLSGGQKVKVTLAAALWSKPQVLVLDEPTNFLDREAVGGLANAIKAWSGAVCIISHNMEFVNALCTEIWNVEGGKLTHKGKQSVTDDNVEDIKPSRTTSKAGTPRGGRSALASGETSAVTSAANSAAPSDAEGADGADKGPKIRKKKLSRNEQKAKDARRAKRKLDWLSYGGDREPDTGEFMPSFSWSFFFFSQRKEYDADTFSPLFLLSQTLTKLSALQRERDFPCIHALVKGHHFRALDRFILHAVTVRIEGPQPVDCLCCQRKRQDDDVLSVLPIVPSMLTSTPVKYSAR